MSVVPVILLFTWYVMFMAKIHPSSALDKCIANANCRGNLWRKVCCAKDSYPSNGCVRSSCVGEYCDSDGDCGGEGECCRSKKCTTIGCPKCSSNSDCQLGLYCCKNRDHNVCRLSCIGETCNGNSDCGSPDEYCISSKNICWKSGLHCTKNDHCKGNGECCKAGVCSTPCSCSSVGGCKSGECCKYGVCTTSCGGDHCSSNSDCGSSCCKRGNLTNVCRTSCVGENCLNDNHCGPSDEFCNLNTTKCEENDNTLAGSGTGWVIAVIVIGVLVLVFICGCGWVYCCCEGKSQRGRVVREAAPQRTAAIIAFRVRETEVRTVSRAPANNYSPSPPPYDNQGLDYAPPQGHQLAPQPKYAMPSPPPQPGYPPAQPGYPPGQPGYPPAQGYPPQPLQFPSP